MTIDYCFEFNCLLAKQMREILKLNHIFRKHLFDFIILKISLLVDDSTSFVEKVPLKNNSLKNEPLKALALTQH